MYLLCISTYYQSISMRQGCEVRVPRDMPDGMLCLPSFQGFLSASARLAARLTADLPRALGQPPGTAKPGQRGSPQGSCSANVSSARDDCSAGWSALCDPNPSPYPNPYPGPNPSPNPSPSPNPNPSP